MKKEVSHQDRMVMLGKQRGIRHLVEMQGKRRIQAAATTQEMIATQF